jgi:dTDP-4-dehydrorhamnose 3,5-epimerase
VRFSETPIASAWMMELEARQDSRGFFARAWCRREFDALGLTSAFAQANLSCTRRAGTVRGLHYQMAPFREAKLVRCTRGAIFDVIVDLRRESLSYLKWFGAPLTADNRRQLYVPEGCAHGYQTLEDDTEVLYQCSEFYTPEAERGVRWDDPAFRIAWPLPVAEVSDKDRAWPDFVAAPVPGFQSQARSSQR